MQQEQRENNFARCFIVRLDAQQNRELEAHRDWLQGRTRRSVSLAEAARDLFRRGLADKRPRSGKSRRRQLQLF